MGDDMRGAWLGAAIAITLATSGAQARDLTYSDILGTWCGGVSNYRFTRQALTVTWKSDNAKRVLRIKKYEFSDHWINVIWADKGNTVFGEFSSDGTMAQQPNTEGDKGPRRPFHRC
jgi:hypothetical protein